MMQHIVQAEDGVLRQIAEEVPVAEIPSRRIRTVIENMKTALREQEDGVAIAAPQIGIPLRIFVVSRRAFLIDDEGHALDIPEEERAKFTDLVFINPEITKASKKARWLAEGCLSVRWKYGKVRRSEKATVRAYDETGKVVTRGGSGLLAQIFQHETDHLNGILFTDTAKNIEELRPEEIIAETKREER